MALVLAAALTLAACATVPTGPTVMVLPGAGNSLEQFQGDDAACRQWAGQQVSSGGDSAWVLQRRYDIAYQQCMYARGNDLPGIPRSSGATGVPSHRVPAPPPSAGTPPLGAPPPQIPGR